MINAMRAFGSVYNYISIQCHVTLQEASTTKKQESPPIGMKIKLSKTGDASIIQQDIKVQAVDDHKESKPKDKAIEDLQEGTKRTESPIGMKIKLSKYGDASVIANEPLESIKESAEAERTESPIGVKIKLAKTKSGSASIITSDSTEESADGSKKSKTSKKREMIAAAESELEASKQQQEAGRTKSAKTSVERDSGAEDTAKAGIMKINLKLSKSGDASVVHAKTDEPTAEAPKNPVEQPIGMKIKLSKTGDPSIIHPEAPKDAEDEVPTAKTKHSKTKDHG